MMFPAHSNRQREHLSPALHLGIMGHKSPFERRRFRLHMAGAGQTAPALSLLAGCACPMLSQDRPGKETSLKRSAPYRVSLGILKVAHWSKTSTLSQVWTDIHIKAIYSLNKYFQWPGAQGQFLDGGRGGMETEEKNKRQSWSLGMQSKEINELCLRTLRLAH